MTSTRTEVRRPEVVPAHARVGLIDGFSCAADLQPIALPHGAQRLVALLALSEGPQSRQDLGRMLWPDVPAEHALAALRTTLWRLRRLCPGMIVGGEPDGLRLIADVDVRDLMSEATIMLDRSVGCLPGSELLGVFRSCLDLLPGWYDDWVLVHRERLLAVRVQVLRVTAARLSAEGRFTEAVDLGLAALRIEPLDEPTHMLVASIHLRQGNASEALRQYRLCARLFADELGVAPSAAFRALLPH